jgi:hypothetical protein
VNVFNCIANVHGESMFQKIAYEQLNSRQQENYNFQKVAAHLADYGYNCLRLSDDWQGADFIACHVDGSFLRVQLKGRLNVDKKYSDKDLHIAFCDMGTWYLYPHDEVMKLFLAQGLMAGSKSWDEGGGYSWPSLTVQIKALMQKYAIL